MPSDQITLDVTLPGGQRKNGQGDQIFWQLTPGDTTVGVTLNQPAQEVIYTVRGRVMEPDGSPIQGVTVRAFDIGLQGEALLGETVTDDEGGYLISYAALIFLDQGKSAPDLDLRVFDAQGDKIAWLPNAPLFNARLSEKINLVRDGRAYTGPSDFQFRVEALQPILSDINIAALGADQLVYVIKKSGQNADQVVRLARAARMSILTQQPPELFYALFGMGLPQTLPALLRQNPEVVRSTLHAAVVRNLIPECDASQVDQKADELLASFKSAAVELAMQAPLEEGRFSLGSLLSTTLENEAHQRRFLQVYADHDGTIEAFWQSLESDPELGSSVRDLQRTLQLSALSLNHPPMLAHLQQMKLSGQFESISDLVSLAESDWQQIIIAEELGVPPSVPGADGDERVLNYARVMTDMVEDGFPNAFMAQRLPDGELKNFFTDQADFRLKTTPVGRYLREHNVYLSEDAVADLRAMQRVYRIAPRQRAMTALLSDGLDSAYRICRMGRKQFLHQYTPLLGSKEARCAYERAHQVHAMGMQLLSEAGMLIPGIQSQVLRDERVPEIEGMPDWETLFKDSLELCDCQHCRSVLSPAAYLVDVLHFLSDRPAADDAQTGRERKTLEFLFERRPDLGDIKLTCDNTNIPVPYVDLVNEILEDAVARPADFTAFGLNSDWEEDLNQHIVSEALRDVFEQHNCPLEFATVTVGGENLGRTPLAPWWTIDDLRFTYGIRKQDNELKVVSRSRQTKGSAAERAAMPQYLNPAAYERLGTRVFPWTLPFDLDDATIDIYLSHLGTSRAEILETFLSGEPVQRFNEPQWVHEVLGLTDAEADIICGRTNSQPGAVSPGPWNLWGFEEEIPDPNDNTTWLDIIAGRADVFLQQSGLSYLEMLDLLDTYFINPATESGRRIRLESVDPDRPDTCETCCLRLAGLEEELDTALWMVRFVRLWRRLGWTIRDLDQAITALGPEDPNSFLISLAHIVKLQDQLRLPVARLFPLWTGDGARVYPIWTHGYIDHHAPEQPILPSLYEKVFRNPAVIKTPDPELPADPAQLSGALNDYAVPIAAALGISTGELDLLQADEKVLNGNNALNLVNLAKLYRHVTLAKALTLKINDYLSLLALQSEDIFAAPLSTLLFTEDVDLIEDSGFNMQALDYLLRHTPTAVEVLDPTTEAVARVLEALRTGLQAIAAENSYRDDPTDPRGMTIDPKGELTRQKLALLEWDPERIDSIITTLNNSIVYQAELDALPDGFSFPDDDELKGKIAFNAANQVLTFQGVMSQSEYDSLMDGHDSAGNYGVAIQTLFDTSRHSNFLKRNLRAFPVPVSKFSPLTLPDRLIFPKELKDKIYYDAVNQSLHYRGVMTIAERATLLELDNSTVEFKAAVNDLYNQLSPDDWVPPADDVFLTTEDIDDLLDDDSGAAISPTLRFGQILEKLLPHLKKNFSRRLIFQMLGEAHGLPTDVCSRLLNGWLKWPPRENSSPKVNLIRVFEQPAFVESSPYLPVTPKAFPEQFDGFRWLHKAAMVISTLKLSTIQLCWLFEFVSSPWPDLNNLPVEPARGQDVDLLAWKHLWRLCRLRDSLPNGEALLDEILRLARTIPAVDEHVAAGIKQAIIERLNVSLGWPTADLETLLGAGPDDSGLMKAVFPDDYLGETLFCRLRECFRLIKRMGVSAQVCGALCESLHSLADFGRGRRLANQTVQAVRAKYDDERWFEIAKPLRDRLREQQRAALVSYLVNHPANGLSFQDAKDLYAYYLIDPEMSPCMMTSRIKQAHSTVQLFVQRCLMNLEPQAQAIKRGMDDEAWRNWSWMKNYRVWEANRKVFLYPENWIEPELRDDKSPFFEELESELMQSDVTLESAAQAMLGYLEKLNPVARLEVVGEYHQREKYQDGNRALDILHVFGRTTATPREYFYRRRVDSNYWTAWEQIDVDIEGDHLVPVVWNRRLYLFWPIFTQKPREEMKGSDKNLTETTTAEMIPEKIWEVQLAWSEYRDGKWTAKKVSSQKVQLPLVENLTDSKERFLVKQLDDGSNEGALTIFILWDQEVPLSFYGDFSGRYIQRHCSSILSLVMVINDNLSTLNQVITPTTQNDIESAVDSISSSALNIAWHLGNIRTIQESSELINHFTNICTATDTIIDAVHQLESCTQDVQVELWSGGESGYLRHWIKVMDSARNILSNAERIDSQANTWIQTIENALDIPGFRFGPSCKMDPAIIYAGILDVWNQMTKQKVSGTQFKGPYLKGIADNEDLFLPVPEATTALTDVPGRFSLLPRADAKELYTSPFFYMDARRTFLVEPYTVKVPIEWSSGYQIDPGSLIDIADSYTENLWGIDVSEGETSDPDDPPYYDNTYPEEDVPSGHHVRSLRAGDALAQKAKMTSAFHDTMIKSRFSMPGMSIYVDLNVDVELDNNWWNGYRTEYRYRFHNFYHPFVCKLMWQLQQGGLEGLLQRKLQTEPRCEDFAQKGDQWLAFAQDYDPTDIVDADAYPVDDMNFENSGAYAFYNWELFFHVPLLIAERLRQNQRFEEAQQWMHYVFDPTDRSNAPVPKRYWKTRPFFERSEENYQKNRIEQILRTLAGDGDSGSREMLAELEQSVSQWRHDPFKPHLIARLRTTAYQKTVVMKYIENLIAWGDQMFRRDTIESINEATQLYILAAEILGPRPEDIPVRATAGAHTFNSLQSELGDFSNAMVAIEEFIPPSADMSRIPISNLPDPTPIMYFCAPRNEKLLGYWDTVADRLFKIRHCMNIKGVVRQLPLFQPPIDPALLVRAAAAGVDIDSVLNDITGALPGYRFVVMVQKAGEICAELKSLGAALLTNLEKRDAEALARMRAGHETGLLARIEEVKEQQIEEAKQNLAALRCTREVTVARYMHYQKLLGVQSPKIPAEGQVIPEAAPSPYIQINEMGGVKNIPLEEEEEKKLSKSHKKQNKAVDYDIAASIVHIIPDWVIAPWGSGLTIGGTNAGYALSAVASSYRSKGAKATYQANLSAKLAHYAWRAHDWTLQNNLAAKEIMQIDAQIVASEIRVALAEKDLDNHRRQMENAEAVETFMRDKYTNEALYGWMTGQVSGLYFQIYQLAYDLAKQAERTFQHELGLENSDYIRFGYWDGLKKGLLAGENLALDLKRMEVAYHEKNRREYELTKQVSLMQVDPLALIRLRELGNCTLVLPESLFDMDCPGHYFRRIKHVALSIPCITGPHTSINCKLTLLKSTIRKSTSASSEDDYIRSDIEDNRFIDNYGSSQAVVMSGSIQDSGLFEPNLRDERYLPFEGAGVISEWRLELPEEWRQFDYDTISDVILHVRYTAREGGELLRRYATEHLSTLIENAEAAGSLRLFSIRHDFPTAWAEFKAVSDDKESYPLTMKFSETHYPFWTKGKLSAIESAEVFVRATTSVGVAYEPYEPGQEFEVLGDGFGQLYAGSLSSPPASPMGEYTLYFDTNDIDDLWLVFGLKCNDD
ncbi:neuraminidase-like domain-containing protein [uncultured Desulfobacter sp.]|uniref:Tc toxin subunit A-related protein n=1 Tax=uncultured Desulfobacter sp. TaxID=240139 RepID=UPI0029C88BA8|nr:neuraminidase-like domain-containing protein [uncultured Desulfobacter sp.]